MDASSVILVVGYAASAFIFLRCLCFLWSLFRCYCLTSLGFVKDLNRYGEWVVVTGATDGIGKAYARQFAKRAFKVVLISRNRAKLEIVAKELEDEFHVETKVICFDFTQTTGYDEIENPISDLDIGILVNNVGMAYGELSSFISSDIDKMCDIIHVNVFSDVRLSHIVSKGMLARKRGAIIHVSSGTIYLDIPNLSIYPSTKIFMKKFVNSLKLEHSGIIDHQLLIPGYVASNMSKKKPGFGIPCAEDYVSSAIKTIGISDNTCGYLLHDIQCAFLLLVPHSIKQMIFERIRRDIEKCQ